jgi:putative intracellular protease/amidase
VTDARARRSIRAVLISLLVLAVVVRFGLPALLHGLGLHPEHEGRAFDLAGRRALIVATNHDRLGDSGKATGVASSELTAPYYAFQDAGMAVDLASVRGGRIPVDPQTLLWLIRAPQDDRALDDPVLQEKLASSKQVGALDFTDYDVVFLAGGWGAAYDLGYSDELGQRVSEANAAGKVLGGVCHGPLGLLRARAADGKPLVEGRRLTAVTDKQVHELGIDVTPQHPETELRRAGAQFESSTAFRDMFANHVVVDGNLVTGQNQNAGAETAQKMMALLEERS